MKTRPFLVIALLLLLQIPGKEAYANILRGQYLDWLFFSEQQGKELVCYLISVPLKKSSSVQNRGEPYFIITKSPEVLAEISVVSGYYYKPNSEVELSFGLRKFNLITHKTHAWTYQIDDDIEIIKAMRDSDDIVVKSISSDNDLSMDSYSLIGFNKAYDMMQKTCL